MIMRAKRALEIHLPDLGMTNRELFVIGIKSVILKQMLTVNAVQQFIQHRQVAAIANLPGIEGQMIEYIAREGARITRKTLRETRFPHSAVVGAILRNGTLLIPNGQTIIQPGDRTVMFALPSALPEIDRLFS